MIEVCYKSACSTILIYKANMTISVNRNEKRKFILASHAIKTLIKQRKKMYFNPSFHSHITKKNEILKARIFSSIGTTKKDSSLKSKALLDQYRHLALRNL
jgi:hypothetical protein